MRDQGFTPTINEGEGSVVILCGCYKEFSGKLKSTKLRESSKQHVSAFHHLGGKMSIKVYFLFSHLDKFPENVGSVSDEQGERFHQDLMTVEECYQDRLDRYMLADYCWSITRDGLEKVYMRKSYKGKFLP